MSPIRRRQFLIATGALLAAPIASFAQQQGRIWRVGYLGLNRRPASIDSGVTGALIREMRELGYVEGKNLVIEWRFADGNSERLPDLAAELVRLKVDVLVSESSPATSALQKASPTIPIVMAVSGDPVRSGYVKSLARPGGNITGLSTLFNEMSAKQLELLLGMLPKLSRVAVLTNPANSTHAPFLQNVQSAAQQAGITVLSVEARTGPEIENAFPMMIQGKAEALIVVSDALILMHYRKIAELAAKNRLPSVSNVRQYVEAGGLISYGPNLEELYRRAATYVDKIFKGAKPADLPVEQSMKFELFINNKAAKALGVKIPQAVLVRADRVIE